ncbi:VOC family protein [Tessaracoccus sp. MC1756]|uniref:VOC family protein n=1 Tax=Tessaracoccus sp. MC1756 TaxID=2760311 RepID=UPI0015FF5908|nr:VOC family protein [Tessaracoccus sp. MC1756]MBB1508403.1 VOC family protein [Tessaracoccus sp. MC1756]
MTDTTLKGAPIWVELYAQDLPKAQAFYGSLFGWRFDNSGEEYGNYHMIMRADEVVGGAMVQQPDMGIPTWCIYLRTDDIRAMTERARQAGGEIHVEPMEIPGQGTMAFLSDSTGAALGAWQSDTVAIQAKDKPGAPVWFELMTGNYDAALEFYRDVFQWDVQPVGDQGMEWQYATNGQGDDAVAGLCDASEFVPSKVPVSYWRVYFSVADTDEAIGRIQELGGRLVDGPMDSPNGRVATVEDDQGVQFQIVD